MKRYKIIVTIVLLVILVLISLIFLNTKKNNNINDIVGHKILLDYGEDKFVHTYFSEDRMRWESIEGEEKGLSDEEEYNKIQIADSVYLISWIEKSGTVVAITMNLETREANAVAAFPDNGLNKIWRLSGKIEVID